jgi:hypothetical protein
VAHDGVGADAQVGQDTVEEAVDLDDAAAAFLEAAAGGRRR